MVEIEIEGITELFKKFDELTGIGFLRNPMKESMFILQDYISNYPPKQRSTNFYKRTGTLGRSWTTIVNDISFGLEGKVGTKLGYAPFVQSSIFQARWNKNWWQTDQSAIEKKQELIISIFTNAIKDAVK